MQHEIIDGQNSSPSVLRRCIGRGHLLDLGVHPSTIARWLRSGILLRTAFRGFYQITTEAFASLQPPQSSAACEPDAAVPPSNDLDSARPSPALRVVPCTLKRARAYVAQHHRHLGPPVGGLFAVGLVRGTELVGVAIVGRPVARMLQDGQTAEVTRVCTPGVRNACSMLLGACRRASIALGYRRLVTYTLASEPGSSLRAAGFRETAVVRGAAWSRASRPRNEPTTGDKRRWKAPIAGSVSTNLASVPLAA